MIDIDFAIAFGIFLIGFVAFITIFWNLLGTQTAYVHDVYLQSEVGRISYNLQSTSMFENIKYAKIKLLESGGYSHAESINLTFMFDGIPENIKVYDLYFNPIDFNLLQSSNVVNISFSKTFSENEVDFLFLTWKGARLENFYCSECQQKSLKANALFSDDCNLRVAAATSFDYEKIRNEIGTDVNFNINVSGTSYGPTPYEPGRKYTISLLNMENGFIVPRTATLEVW